MNVYFLQKILPTVALCFHPIPLAKVTRGPYKLGSLRLEVGELPPTS